MRVLYHTKLHLDQHMLLLPPGVAKNAENSWFSPNFVLLGLISTSVILSWPRAYPWFHLLLFIKSPLMGEKQPPILPYFQLWKRFGIWRYDALKFEGKHTPQLLLTPITSEAFRRIQPNLKVGWVTERLTDHENFVKNRGRGCSYFVIA